MTKTNTLKIGDVIPASIVRGVASSDAIRRDGVPVSHWYALRVMAGRERAAIETLARDGVYAFCPMSPRTRIFRGKKIETEYPTVTQIIYARFRTWPRWDVLKDRRVITGVFCHGSIPIILPKDVIRTLQGLPVKAERLRAAQDELMRVHVGEVVKLEGGPFSGFTVDVTKSVGRRVWWQTILANGMPMTGECSRDDVVKLGVAS